MSKKLSKQICEKCGIKPKIKCPQYYTTKCKEYNCINCDNYVATYPDFGQPENFVKLFTMITTIEDFDFRIGNFYIPYIPSYRQISTLKTGEEEYSSENSNPIKAFLTCVLKCVSKDKDTAEYIREAEWKYD